MVDLQAVTVSFRPHFVLQGLTLSVPQGGSLALWGPNGAGKSTTFHAILDQVPYAGQIRVAGLDARQAGAVVRRMIGWAPQDLAPSDLTVERTLRFMADLRRTPVRSVPNYLRPYALEDAAGTKVAALSGGQRKRLSIALALLGDPPVLLLDEPTANLDPTARQQVVQLLRGLKQQGKTIVLASHRLGDVLRLADRVAILAEGYLNRIVPAARMVRRRAVMRA